MLSKLELARFMTKNRYNKGDLAKILQALWHYGYISLEEKQDFLHGNEDKCVYWDEQSRDVYYRLIVLDILEELTNDNG